AEAYEGFRKEFGALNNEISTSMKLALSGAEQMGQYGVGFYSIFTDQAQAIQFFGQAFSDLGPLVDTFASEIAEMGEEFVILTRGLGISGESLKMVGNLAKSTGKDMKDVLQEIGAQAVAMENAFGVSSKLIGKDLGAMVADVRNFGNNSIKSLGAAAMRVRSLGLEVKSLGKLVDKFLNFEDAAKSASMLSQSFGVNLDTLQLMNGAAKGGAETLDSLRNAMFSAGRDASKMSTAELRLLAQTTGLSEEEARLAFSMENRGKSMEDIKKAAAKADPQERMADTMERLADNIERVIRVFEFDSFFGAFFTGFSKGVSLSKPFVKMLSDLHEALMIVHWAGFTVGKMFMEVFPGIQQMITAFNGVFNPEVFTKFREELEGAFDFLFKALKEGGDPVQIMTEFWGKMKSAFDIVSLFGDDTKKAFKQGFMDFLGGLRDIVIGTIPMIVKSITGAINTLISIITTGEAGIPGAFKNASGEVTGFAGQLWSDIFMPLWKALKDAWNDPNFVKARQDLVSTIWSKIKSSLHDLADYLVNDPEGQKIAVGIAGGLALLIGGPAILSIIGGAIFSLVGTIVSTLGSALAAGFASVFAGLPGLIIGLVGSLFVAGAGVKKGMEEFYDDTIGEVSTEAGRQIAASLAGILDILTLGLLSDEFIADVGIWFGQLYDKFSEGIRNIPVVGDFLADSYSETILSAISMLEKIGDMVFKAFEGELTKEDFADLGSKIASYMGDALVLSLTTLVSGLGFLVTGIVAYGPQIFTQLQAWLAYGLAAVSEFIAGFLGEIPLIGPALAAPFELMSGIFTAMGDYFQWVTDSFVRIREAFMEAPTWVGAFWSVLSTVGENIKKLFTETIPSAGTAMLEGIKEALSGIAETMAAPFEEGWESVKSFFGIQSPSALFRDELGGNLAAGMMAGLDTGLQDAPSTITEALNAEGIVNAVTSEIGNATSAIVADTEAINRAISDIPEIDVPIKIEPGTGNVLGVKDNKLELTSKALNIVLNLNVTMEADKIANVILDTKKVMPKEV
ncbi:MAG: hypothetical protein ACW96N_00455, partial [Candidatus Thorarchaeota archaeon]